MTTRAQRIRRSRKWTRLSKQYRATHPWCAICGSTELLELDHIVPLAAGGAAWDPANLQVLCRYHNRSKGAAILLAEETPADTCLPSLPPTPTPFPKPEELT